MEKKNKENKLVEKKKKKKHAMEIRKQKGKIKVSVIYIKHIYVHFENTKYFIPW